MYDNQLGIMLVEHRCTCFPSFLGFMCIGDLSGNSAHHTVLTANLYKFALKPLQSKYFCTNGGPTPEVEDESMKIIF